MKSLTVFICSKCDSQFPKWTGRCLSCGAWNTLSEQPQAVRAAGRDSKPAHPQALSGVHIAALKRLSSGLAEVDGILGKSEDGSGLVPGSLVLLGGDPGIGKSTLALQVALHAANSGTAVLYVSGEESLPQIKLRAQRITPALDRLQVLSENNLEIVLATVEATKPTLVIIDSVQTMYSEAASGVAGGIAQVSYATARILECAKTRGIATVLIGHVTKEGNLAGPRMLEHMVDVVLYLEGERDQMFRILRCVKNRFGATNEVGVLQMQESGLAAVANPSDFFLSQRLTKQPGTAVTCTVEGSRALLLEIQSLTVKTQFSYPRRTATGFDPNRLLLLAAVLQKHLALGLAEQDIFLNVAGGFRISETGCDLAAMLAIYSSLRNQPLPETLSVVGEVGLSGEIRTVTHIDKRVTEAAKLGFKKIIVPAGNKIGKTGIQLLPAVDLKQAVRFLK